MWRPRVHYRARCGTVKDLTKGTFTGGAFTAVAYALLLLLLIAELGAFLRRATCTEIPCEVGSPVETECHCDALGVVCIVP
eukprot:Skav221478  [mRNA]  locus=scaffold2365:28132:33385:- [translate_table: standard]